LKSNVILLSDFERQSEILAFFAGNLIVLTTLFLPSCFYPFSLALYIVYSLGQAPYWSLLSICLSHPQNPPSFLKNLC